MNADTLFIIKVVFGMIAAIFTLSAAAFGFIDLSQNDKTENTQAWFRAKWKAISNSRWLILPENATRWLLNAQFYRNFNSKIQSVLNQNITIVLLASLIIINFIACLIHWGILFTCLYLIVTCLLLTAVLSYLAKKYNPSCTSSPFGMSIFISSGLLIFFLWLPIIIRQNIYHSVVIIIIFLPFLWISAVVCLLFLPFVTADFFHQKYFQWLLTFLFTLGVTIGFAITLFALLIGHIFLPSAYVPQTLQMLFSNAIFDGITMAITFVILAKALSKEGLLRLPVAIGLDILVAGIFAVCSLYFGSIFTDKAVGLKEIFYILFARSADNSHFELSPYFWVMHTTFIPTVLYLSLILFCWIGKALLIPVRWFFGKGQEHKNPLKLTAGLCTLFAAVFGVLFFATNSFQERVKDLKLNQNPPAINENR